MSDDHSSAIKLVTAPTTEPITLDQAKAFLRIEHTADDDTITRAIVAARQAAEHYLRLLLLPQSWTYARANPCDVYFRLPVGPAQSVTSITITNELGDVTTLDAVNYRLSVDGFSVLFTTVPQGEAVTVHYSAGAYETSADIPAPIIQGMLHHIAAMVENRDGSAALPAQALYCYQPFRRVLL